ncbi:NB-ARC domain-containing protein [Streptomyces sp. NPDC087532]|uniref:NB-ARC domain-containing protein n=1 Tax=Streptomyces sp. NPDC087532 TaxID=3365795 RepID=UPI00380DD2FC
MNHLPGNVDGQLAQVGVAHGPITFNYHAAEAVLSAAGRRLNQVPRPPRSFVNRHRALAELDEVLAADDFPGCPIGVFSGLPGIGKTAAASQWAHINHQRFPGGQLFIDFAQLRSGAGADVSEALAICLRALGVHDQYLPVGFAERTALYRDLSAERGGMLVVLDDVTRPAQVTPLVPQGPRSALLATSTWRLGELVLDGAALLQLDVLDPDSAVELLSAVCGQQRIADEPDAAKRLVELCGGLPIAVRLCGARLLTHPRLTVGELVAELSDEQSRLSRIAVSSAHEERTMSAALELAYRDLPETAARMYRTLGHLPGLSFDTAVAAVAAGLAAAEEAKEALDVLERASLLSVMEDRRYALHSLVRLHAREMSLAQDPPSAARETVGRVLDHYRLLTVLADLAIRADRLRVTATAEITAAAEASSAPGEEASTGVGPFAGTDDPGRDALCWLEAERSNILAVLRAAAELGFARPVWQTVEAFTVLFLHHRHLADWRESSELGIDAARRDGAVAAEARLRSLASRPHMDLGQDERAKEHLDIAERLAVESGHVVLQASVQEFAGRYWDRHEPSRAVDAYRASLTLNAEAGEVRGEALARYFLGCAQSAAGDHMTALTTLRRARTALLSLDDYRMAARALADTGRTKARLGDTVDAIADLSRAAADLRRSRAFHYEAQAVEDLAGLLEDPEEVRACLRRALVIYEEGGSPRAAAVLARLTAG